MEKLIIRIADVKFGKSTKEVMIRYSSTDRVQIEGDNFVFDRVTMKEVFEILKSMRLRPEHVEIEREEGM